MINSLDVTRKILKQRWLSTIRDLSTRLGKCLLCLTSDGTNEHVLERVSFVSSLLSVYSSVLGEHSQDGRAELRGLLFRIPVPQQGNFPSSCFPEAI
jgi:hypothetical protein